MRRIDRLGWSDAVVLDAFGVRVGLRSDSRALLRRATERWTSVGARVVTTEEVSGAEATVAAMLSFHSGARDVTAEARPKFSLYDGALRLIATGDREVLLESADAMLRVGVAEYSPTHLCVHAGVVGYRGQAILLPGACLAGKTTLVRALLELGASYYSDDLALVDEAGLVVPFARPLAVREDARSPQRPVTPQSLRADVGTTALRVGLVALASYRSGGSWRPKVLSGAAATLALIPHTGGVQSRPGRTMKALSCMLADATVLRGFRGEASACAKSLLATLDAPSALPLRRAV